MRTNVAGTGKADGVAGRRDLMVTRAMAEDFFLSGNYTRLVDSAFREFYKTTENEGFVRQGAL